MKISLGSDHAGFLYKEAIKRELEADDILVNDHGPSSEDSVDYPDFAHPVATDVSNERVDFGVLICGSGNGVSMTANKHENIRAALCWNNEITALARQHNNANVICIPARFTSEWQAIQMVKTFLKTEFEAGRHERRVNKIPFSC